MTLATITDPALAPYFTAAEVRKIDAATDELAIQAFELPDDYAITFIAEAPLGGAGDQEYGHWRDAALDYCANQTDDLRRAMELAYERLRDRYITTHRDLYRARALDDLQIGDYAEDE